MKMYFTLFVCVTFCVAVRGQLAPFITPCYSWDSTCLINSAQRAVPVLAAGVPNLGISPMDPMHMKRVVANQAGLAMDFRNTVVRGLRNCKVESLKRQAHQTFLDLKCSVTMIGDYTLGGNLLILPIEGNGKYKIKTRDILVKIVFNVGERMANGEKYWTLQSWKHTFNVQTNAEFHFQNLFNGNKQLSDAIHDFANSNWREIFQEVAPPIVKAIVSEIVDQCTKLFNVVPIRELALN